MVTVDNQTTTYNGLATDTKPTDARNGDAFIEIDTGKLFVYDEENVEWTEITISGGGGGGGGEEPLIVTLTPESADFSGSMNTDPQEIFESFMAHKKILFYVEGMDAVVEATFFATHDFDTDGEIDGVNAAALVTYNVQGQDFLIQITTDAQDPIYYTTLFPLTPMGT